MNAIEVITLFVEDLAAAKSFYHQVFRRPVVYEDAVSAVLKFDNLLLNLLQATEAPGLVEPLAVAPRGAGARMLLTIAVDDVDAVCRELESRGVRLLNGPIDRPWGRRTAAFADPAGNVWEIAHDLPKA